MTEIVEEKIVKLKWSIPIPIEGGGEVHVKELRLGRLKAKHLKLLPEGFMESEGSLEPAQIIPLLAGLADIPESSIDELDIMDDLPEVAEVLQNFLEGSLSQKTGKK